MEVHHHAHTNSIDNHRGRKKWTHYFWEFLMLFLAVFCGFLAENFREHQIEKHRGEQYIYSFREDLKKDTAQCNISITELTATMEALKDLIGCFNTLKENSHSTDCLKEIIINSRGFKDFIYTDRTIQQLKNAGGLRLISDKEIADSIVDYDGTIREMHIHQGVLENIQQNSKNAHNKMIDFLHLEDLNQKKQTGELFLLSDDPAELNKYFNAINEFKTGLNGQLIWMLYIKNKAMRLFDLLDKKGYK